MATKNQNDGAFVVNMNPANVGTTERGMFGQTFQASNIAREDWIRGEQSANNALARDLYLNQQANAFNASEAEKQRAFEERMSSTSYSRAVEDMKRAGINPQIALSNGANASSTPQGASAQASASRSSGATASRGFVSPFGIGELLGLVLTAGKLGVLAKTAKMQSVATNAKLANESVKLALQQNELALKNQVHNARVDMARSNFRHGNRRNIHY